MREYLKRRYQTRMAQAKIFLGGVCVRCGSYDFLELDHIDPSTKKWTVSAISWMSESGFWDEVKKCQLLCETCHIQKTREDRGSKNARETHGTLSSYRYCKCVECRYAKSQWSKRYYKRTNISRTVLHGTRSGYLKEIRSKTLVCDLCREANKIYHQQLRQRKVS